MSVVLQKPQGRENITLTSSDPAAPPAINPNYLGNELDWQTMVEAYRYAMGFMETPVMKKYRPKGILAPSSSSTEDIEVSEARWNGHIQRA